MLPCCVVPCAKLCYVATHSELLFLTSPHCCPAHVMPCVFRFLGDALKPVLQQLHGSIITNIHASEPNPDKPRNSSSSARGWPDALIVTVKRSGRPAAAAAGGVSSAGGAQVQAVGNASRASIPPQQQVMGWGPAQPQQVVMQEQQQTWQVSAPMGPPSTEGASFSYQPQQPFMQHAMLDPSQQQQYQQQQYQQPPPGAVMASMHADGGMQQQQQQLGAMHQHPVVVSPHAHVHAQHAADPAAGVLASNGSAGLHQPPVASATTGGGVYGGSSAAAQGGGQPQQYHLPGSAAATAAAEAEAEVQQIMAAAAAATGMAGPVFAAPAVSAPPPIATAAAGLDMQAGGSWQQQQQQQTGALSPAHSSGTAAVGGGGLGGSDEQLGGYGQAAGAGGGAGGGGGSNAQLPAASGSAAAAAAGGGPAAAGGGLTLPALPAPAANSTALTDDIIAAVIDLVTELNKVDSTLDVGLCAEILDDTQADAAAARKFMRVAYVTLCSAVRLNNPTSAVAAVRRYLQKGG